MILSFLGRFKNSFRLGFGFAVIFMFFFASILIAMAGTQSVSRSMKDLYRYSFALNTSILQIDSDISKIQFLLSQASDADREVLEGMIKEIEAKNSRIRENFEKASAAFKGIRRKWPPV